MAKPKITNEEEVFAAVRQDGNALHHVPVTNHFFPYSLTPFFQLLYLYVYKRSENRRYL